MSVTARDVIDLYEAFVELMGERLASGLMELLQTANHGRVPNGEPWPALPEPTLSSEPEGGHNVGR